MFLITVLIMYSTQLSTSPSINLTNPIFKKTIILKDNESAFSILLHSITFYDYSISGYSDKFDSFMTFPINHQDINVVRNKLEELPYNVQECNRCHQEEWN